MLEETHRELYAQDAANGVIDGGLRHLTGLHDLHHVAMIKIADHIHIDAGQKGFTRGGRSVDGDSVGHDFRDGIPIAHHETSKAPFVF